MTLIQMGMNWCNFWEWMWGWIDVDPFYSSVWLM